ncbi:MAG: response regulator [Candidatus Methylacidiphilales bacterium]|nr:response regulator transcription factor [Candidatus Methylacidiphilales bacterium]
MPDATLPRKKSLLVVDDHPLMRSGLAQLINSQPDMVVMGEAGNPGEALTLLSLSLPDLLLTDLTMPGRSGTEFIKDLSASYPDLPILVISMHDETVYAERCLRAGARGYIMKEAGSEKLLTAVRCVLNGETYVSAAMSERILRNLSSRKPRGSHSPIQKLSDREFEVFQLIGVGKSTRDIAGQLNLSPKTVDVHRAHIREKLELGDITALVRYAVRWMEVQNPGS